MMSKAERSNLDKNTRKETSQFGNGLITTETIFRDTSFFSKGGCKCTPLLQQELGIVAFRLPLEMHLQGRVTAPPAPTNSCPFLGAGDNNPRLWKN